MAAEAAVWYHFWSVLDTYVDGNVERVGERIVTVREKKKLMEFWIFYHEIKIWGSEIYLPSSTFLTTKKRELLPL